MNIFADFANCTSPASMHENKIVQASRAIRAGIILLIDKKGLLYDMDGDAELNKKVEALLVGD